MWNDAGFLRVSFRRQFLSGVSSTWEILNRCTRSQVVSLCRRSHCSHWCSAWWHRSHTSGSWEVRLAFGPPPRTPTLTRHAPETATDRYQCQVSGLSRLLSKARTHQRKYQNGKKRQKSTKTAWYSGQHFGLDQLKPRSSETTCPGKLHHLTF